MQADSKMIEPPSLTSSCRQTYSSQPLAPAVYFIFDIAASLQRSPKMSIAKASSSYIYIIGKKLLFPNLNFFLTYRDLLAIQLLSFLFLYYFIKNKMKLVFYALTARLITNAASLAWRKFLQFKIKASRRV